MEHEQDRLSYLPKIILHEILSKLHEKDAARTSVLSQTWLDTWNTFPILYFCDTKIIGPRLKSKGKDIVRARFCDYVKKRMLRFCDQNLVIKEFKFKFNKFGISCISKDVDFWLKLACDRGVEIIEYCKVGLVSLENPPLHVLPMCVIEAKSLTKLVLKGNVIISKIKPASFINHSIKLLSLSSVLFEDEQTIEHIISCCPLIEYITLNDCSVLSPPPFGRRTKEVIKSLRMSGLQKLKGVEVYGMHEVFVDAPNLENFWYRPHDWYEPCKIYFDGCRNLKWLYMTSVRSSFFTYKWFLDLFLKFPFLESLKLKYCAMPERIDISSVGLKVLELSHCFNMKEVNIDAPNLLSCECYGTNGYSQPIISFLRSSSQLEVNIKIMEVGYQELRNLRKFVQNIKPRNVLISLSLVFSLSNVADALALDLVVLQVSSPPPRIKHLNLSSIPYDETLFSPIVNILLSSYATSTISFDIDFNIFSRCGGFIEFFYKRLMERKDDAKCWWHDLKDVKFTSSANIDENVDLKTMIKLLSKFPKDNKGKISFILVF